jgi:integrase
MPLTDTAIRNFKPSAKQQKHFDERGLFLIVTPSGGKWWRFRYSIENKEKLLSLGTYPDISLKAARERREEARTLLANGVDPSENRKAVKAVKIEQATNSLETVAREWHNKFSPNLSPSHASRTLSRLQRDIFPLLGTKAISEVTPPELLAVVRKIEERGALESAHRTLSICGQVFRYAVATGRTQRDITADLRGALPPFKGEHFPAITNPKQVGELLRALHGYIGTPIVQNALRLAPLVFVRPGELRSAQWKDFDLDAAEWRYTVTKTNTAHIVPLSRQALAILRELQPLTGNGTYVFPSARTSDRPMSDNAILAALRRMGISKEEMTGHGFRAMARTILDEVLHVRADYIEHQLAHAVRDANGRAYNRTAHLPERHKMMQEWADYLDKMKLQSNFAAA